MVAANSLPSINDITAAELDAMLPLLCQADCTLCKGVSSGKLKVARFQQALRNQWLEYTVPFYPNQSPHLHVSLLMWGYTALCVKLPADDIVQCTLGVSTQKSREAVQRADCRAHTIVQDGMRFAVTYM